MPFRIQMLERSWPDSFEEQRFRHRRDYDARRVQSTGSGWIAVKLKRKSATGIKPMAPWGKTFERVTST
jgi:hypothetical protein